MLQNRIFHCYYVDHSFYSAQKIGRIYSTLAQDDSLDLGDSIVLATCQRIELYTPFEHNPISHLGLPFKHISGRDNVMKRLISIGAGVESQILGERNVFYQVQKSIRDADDKNELKTMFKEALLEAERIRKDRVFYADMNYEDISLAILNEVIAKSDESDVGLVIVGSGMLARDFLQKGVQTQFERVNFITRSPRNLKKKFEKEQKKIVLRCEEFCAVDRQPYYCIIATNGLERDNYAEKVRPILLSESCRGVFDLSAVPLFQKEVGPIFYGDTYSEDYYDYVDRCNDRKRFEAQCIKNDIMDGIAVEACRVETSEVA